MVKKWAEHIARSHREIKVDEDDQPDPTAREDPDSLLPRNPPNYHKNKDRAKKAPRMQFNFQEEKTWPMHLGQPDLNEFGSNYEFSDRNESVIE